MKLLALLFGNKRKVVRKTNAEYQRELLVRQGKQQFEKLNTLGLTIPVKLA